MDISIFDEFPLEPYKEEIVDYFPQFVLYRRKGRKTYCHCTNCHEDYIDGLPTGYEPFVFSVDNSYKHNEVGVCSRCGAEVQLKSAGMSRQGYYKYCNFAIYKVVGAAVLIRCIRVIQRFYDNSMEPDYGYIEKARYILEEGSAVQYYNGYDHPDKCGNIYPKWKRKKSLPSEPVFSYGGFYQIADKQYKVIGIEELRKSFLKYSVDISVIFGVPITFFSRIALHPQLEYIVKGGLTNIAKSYIHSELRTRFNWRSNDLKKILHLDKNELKLFKEAHSTGYIYDLYIKFRKTLKVSSGEAIKYFQKFDIDYWGLDKLSELSSEINKSPVDLLKYLGKQSESLQPKRTTSALRIYNDYINECKELNYNLSDESVSMPKDIFRSHDRTSKLIKVKAERETEEKLQKMNKEREKFLYTDEEKGIEVLLPDSVEAIINEGKVLSHCVGGYAKRHAEGVLHILFVRKILSPTVPFFTMEVSTDGEIKQLYGYKNNVVRNGGEPKPEYILEFQKEYQEYLDKIFNKKKTA